MVNTVQSPSTARVLHSESLFRTAADQAPHVIWIINSKGAVTYLNHAWYELVGGMPPQWQGHEWMSVVAPEDVKAMREGWTTASATGSIFEGTRRVKVRDGTWRILSFKATPVFDDSGVVCWVGMDSDITELMATQAALQQANRELEAFSYTVSHDLRAPLLSLQGFTKLLSEEMAEVATPKARHYMARVGSAIKSMSGLVDGLLDLARAARDALDFDIVDVSEMAGGILARLAANDPGRKVSTFVQDSIHVSADARLVASMLENLLGNAWKFTAATENARIAVRLVSRTPQEVVFCVEDNGAGFDTAQAGNLFSPFTRLHGSSFPGTGIGLATVQRIVTSHGGRVWADASPGHGAKFFVSLPDRHAAGGTSTPAET